jgi:hypothetical protein
MGKKECGTQKTQNRGVRRQDKQGRFLDVFILDSESWLLTPFD